jgi:hypothetical protein
MYVYIHVQGELETQLSNTCKENSSMKYLNNEFQKVFFSCYETMGGWDKELSDMVEVYKSL